MVQSIGTCGIRVVKQAEHGLQSQFTDLGRTTREAIEEQLWAIREENAEFVNRALEAGDAISKLFNDGIAEAR